MTVSRTRLVVTWDFTFAHKYPGAADSHAYLRDLHRHKFVCTAKFEVPSGTSRYIEFIDVKEKLEGYTERAVTEWPRTTSCEDMATEFAEYLLQELECYSATVCVMEDGENGAEVECVR